MNCRTRGYPDRWTLDNINGTELVLVLVLYLTQDADG